MRKYAGIKPKFALEFTGFSGTPKMFRARFRGETADSTRLYSAADIRKIRLSLIGMDHDTRRQQTLPPIINVRMAKGGTGKSTTASNVVACAAMMGYRTLVIDGDPQSSLSSLFGVDWIKQEVTHVGELMRRANTKNEPVHIREAVIPIYGDGMLDLIAADISMASADGWMMQLLTREQAFVRLLEREIDFFSQYDVIVIDSAPSSSLLTTAFMVASKTILAVIMPEGQSLKALDILESNIQELNDAFPSKEYGVHIVVNRYNQSKKPHQEVLAQVIEQYRPYLNDTIIRDFVGFLRETDRKDGKDPGPVLENEPTSIGARDIIDLTKSLIKLYGIKLGDSSAVTA